MPGKDDRQRAPGVRPAAGGGQSRGAIAENVSRVGHGASGAIEALSGNGQGGERGGTAAHGEDRGERHALGKQTLAGAINQHDAGTRGRPFQPPAILRAPSSLLSHPLFLHPVPQLGAPFRAPAGPPFVPAPLLFAPPVGPPPPEPFVQADSAAAQTQTPDAPQTAEVPSPKVELSVTSSASDTAQTSAETPRSASTVSVTAPSSLSPDSASTTSEPAPDISPITLTPAATLLNSSFTSAGTSDILPVTNTGVGVGGKVAAACVIGAVFLLLLNWAFWLVIRRRRRARRSLPTHWDFAAPPPREKGEAGRDSEEDERDAERDANGGVVTVPV